MNNVMSINPSKLTKIQRKLLQNKWYDEGQKFRIKQYDSIMREFGSMEENEGEIKCGNDYFTNDMKYLCGQEITISNDLFVDEVKINIYGFNITYEMCESL